MAAAQKSRNPAMLAEWSKVAARVGATRKRLEKRAELAVYWENLEDAELTLAVRFFAGQVFALWDARVLKVGHALLLHVLADLTGTDDTELKQRLVALGDLGELAQATWPAVAPSLTLQETFAALSDLVDIRQATGKRTAVRALLARATAQEARYLVGIMLGDLRIGIKESLVEESLAWAYEVAPRAVQWGNMLCGDIGATALLARHGRLGEASMTLFHPLKPMLASPADGLTTIAAQMKDGFAIEDKYDGIRAQVHISMQATKAVTRGLVHDDARVVIFSRAHIDITRAFADLVPALCAMLRASHAHSLLLDGEILAVKNKRVLPFNALQTRLGRRAPTSAVMQATQVAYMAFDVLAWDDEVLLEMPYTARRARLTRVRVDQQHTRVTPSTVTHGIDDIELAFTQARGRGNEGLIIKALASTYTPGRRGREWLKMKRPQATFDVVITAAEVGHGKRHKVLSDYTFAVRVSDTDADLVDIGKAYSGLTDAEIAELTALLKKHTLEVSQHGKRYIVEPSVVLEITCDLVQRSKRYKSGFALRFPRIVRLRPDKRVTDIDTLAAVAVLCAPGAGDDEAQ